MEKITDKQSRFIENICDRLDIDFDLIDSTKQEASKFIKEHIEEYNKLATYKQLDYIDEICKTLGIKFEGETKEEASEFIKKYQHRYQHKCVIRQEKIYNYLYGNNSNGAYEREDYCGISPYDVYNEYDMPHF